MANYKAGLSDMWLTEPYEPKACVLISIKYHYPSHYTNRTIYASNSEKLNKKCVSSFNTEKKNTNE